MAHPPVTIENTEEEDTTATISVFLTWTSTRTKLDSTSTNPSSTVVTGLSKHTHQKLNTNQSLY